MVSWLKSLWKRSVSGPRGLGASAGQSPEELQNAFKTRYHHFKLLLNANNKALEMMTDMEAALRGNQPFGMQFVRSSCTRVSTSVYQIIQHLNELGQGRYERLNERFRWIQNQIQPLIHPEAPPGGGPLVLGLQAVNKELADQAGGKMANLGELKNRLGLRVPNGFVVTADAYRRFMAFNDLQAEIDRLVQSTSLERLDQLYGLSAAIRQKIIRAPLPPELETAISEQYALMQGLDGRRLTVAMRSSALGEDMAGTSFAGQYRSLLNISAENINEAYKEIVAGKYTLQAMSYRLNRGIRDEDVAMCVGCLEMVDAVAGGVLYSANPMDPADETVWLNAAWGLPKSVVDGATASDVFVVSKSEPLRILRRDVSEKTSKMVCYPDEGVCRLEMTGQESLSPSLDDAQVLELARLAIRLELHYGCAQDVEWALEADGSLTVLQCRPLKQSEASQDQEEEETGQGGESAIILRGKVAASPGIGAGPAYPVKKDMDALRFPEGAVLVAAQSLPYWATVLSRAAAVVTEQGSIAGHLANVAREFGVPALFGVPGALERIRSGEMVTVDADALKVYRGRMESLLQRRRPRTRLMEGSPVLETLRACTRHIVPLNLLNPDAPDFKPKNCKTLHDITRFSHEKAVWEMFQFGKEHPFPKHSSKQLHCDVPMQFWVINLDDGFREEEEGRYVRLDNIVSIPMRALWKGMTAVPWEGPPPVDTRGFMSVLLEASANPALDPTMRSSFMVRNYFMVSRHFCSLQSRFGFHFSTVEALVGDRPVENYASFQFKGGAANYDRRQRRAHFVGGILEEYGFRIQMKEDALFARFEGHPQAVMEDRLTLLGYMVIHTRQLDMVMANDASFTHYRNKMMQDLRSVLAKEDAHTPGA